MQQRVVGRSLGAVLAGMMFALGAGAQGSASLEEVVAGLRGNVVAVRVEDAQFGFGFITAEANGQLYLVTAGHVVPGPKATPEVKFFNDLRWWPAKVVRNWADEDLALLELPKQPFVRWRPDCADLTPRLDAEVKFIGLYPEGEPTWVSPLRGEVFAVAPVLRFAIGSIMPGTSGAPLVGRQGILGLILRDAGSFSEALPLSKIKSFLEGPEQAYPYWGLRPLGTAAASQPASEPDPTPTLPPDRFGLIKIAGGTFTMGCTSEQGGDFDSDEKPTRQVTVGDFELGATEVTQAQWRAVLGSDPPQLAFPGCDQCPVEGVSWEDVQTFLQKLNAQTGGGYRLPTEAEWEYAARGGQQSRGYKYAGSNNLDAVAWYTSNSDSKTHPVGQKAPNELGLYDMSGNVWEWCQDWYGDYPSTAQRNPSGPSTGSYRVHRGGSWFFTAGNCRVAFRGFNSPGFRYGDLGFRLAR